ncbi:MAG: hypothetical protein P4L35_06350 [Ignavibacteriaceae bacterium]|nr:hypothetical protein [Ignavibacteriaceae bacterium]
MKILLLSLAFLSTFALSSCMGSFKSTKSDFTKLNSGIYCDFKNHDVIYFLDLDTSCVTYYFTEDKAVKSIKGNDLNLEKYKISYLSDTAYPSFFSPFNKLKIKTNLSPAQYICKTYNDKLELIMKGEEWNVTGGFAPKPFVIHRINKDSLNMPDLIDSIYYSPSDSLKVELTVPRNIPQFCKIFKSRHPDCNYFILCNRFYLTKNIFEVDIDGSWSMSGASPSGMHYSGGSNDIYDGTIIAPQIVIDIKKEKIISYDVRRYGISTWSHMDRELYRMVNDLALYYQLKY